MNVTIRCDNETRPNGAANTTRPLTHSSDLSREGLAVNATQSECHLYSTPSMKLYQAEARVRFESAASIKLEPWAWIIATCGIQCINSDHLIARAPTKIAYPAGVCVYCGMPAGTKDHLLPRNITGDSRRQFVAIVPSCADCNTRINDLPTANIDARRKRAHDSIRKSKRKVLAAPDWTDEDLAEYGPALRSFMIDKRREKAATMARLAWPEDPFYDLRAFQRSGIDDPASIDLCAPMETAA